MRKEWSRVSILRFWSQPFPLRPARDALDPDPRFPRHLIRILHHLAPTKVEIIATSANPRMGGFEQNNARLTPLNRRGERSDRTDPANSRRSCRLGNAQRVKNSSTNLGKILYQSRRTTLTFRILYSTNRHFQGVRNYDQWSVGGGRWPDKREPEIKAGFHLRPSAFICGSNLLSTLKRQAGCLALQSDCL